MKAVAYKDYNSNIEIIEVFASPSRPELLKLYICTIIIYVMFSLMRFLIWIV